MSARALLPDLQMIAICFPLINCSLSGELWRETGSESEDRLFVIDINSTQPNDNIIFFGSSDLLCSVSFFLLFFSFSFLGQR
uniref:Uncharacterized protein n=1 Tax=Anopheles darlingi TaxID=43151 RepID=A0A2M4DJY9_ANODA